MLENLQWPTLEHRRKNQRLTTMFKIVRGLIAVPTSSLISADPRTRCNHPYKFKCILASATTYKKILFPEQSSSGTTHGQRNRGGDYHQLLQASPALVHRRRLSTWYCEFVDYFPYRSRYIRQIRRNRIELYFGRIPMCRKFDWTAIGQLRRCHSSAVVATGHRGWRENITQNWQNDKMSSWKSFDDRSVNTVR